MIDIVDKTNGQNVEDYQYNSVKNNSLDIVESSGQTPDVDTGIADSNPQQISIGMSIYAAGGQFYIDSGIANAYVLGVQTISGTPMRAPDVYFNGMTARFTATNTNTGISTANVAGLGIKTIKKENYTADLAASDIVSGFMYDLVYSIATGFFELKPVASPGQLGVTGILDDVLLHNGTNWTALSRDSLFPTAFIVDQKANNIEGGTFTNGAWRTRDFNTVIWDDIGVSVSLNEVTMPIGTYIIHTSAPAFAVANHKTRLFNVTDTSVVAIGSRERSSSGDNVQARSFLSTKLTIAASKDIRLEHICSTTNNGDGFGSATNIAGDSEVEIFSQMFIQEIK